MRMKGQRHMKTEVPLWSEHVRSDGQCFECGRIPAYVWTRHALICGVCWHRARILRYVYDQEVTYARIVG